ncbi:MAG: deoxyribonuclease IV [Parachlamydiales bacterium]|jgi:deoxyribonuclease-4
MENKSLVGCHVSIAGGLQNSLYRGKELGANAIQIFTANQRQWKSKNLSEEAIEKFKQARKETQIKVILSHSSYLINLGSSNKLILDQSIKAFEEEITRCHLLDIDFLVFHPGAYVDSDEEKCLNTVISSLLALSALIKKGKTLLLLETTAGQGTNIGYKFEHLGCIIEAVADQIPIGVCLDTCHIFAAGYDIEDNSGWEKTFQDFSKNIGMKNLKAFHLNDSKEDFGSKKDRHANLGEGKIGLNSFKCLMEDNRFYNIPKILETPDENLWKKEINLLKEFAR